MIVAVLSFAAAVSLLVAFLAWRELCRFKRAVGACVRGGGSTVRKDSTLSFGRELLSDLHLFRRRIEALDWERERNEKSDILVESARSDDPEKLFTGAVSKFRCRVSAMLVFGQNPDDQDRFLSRGLNARYFEAQLCAFTAGYRKNGRSDCFGLQDCADSKTVSGDFSLFGVRHVLCFPLTSGNAAPLGVLWLGYSADRPPHGVEVALARQQALKLGQDIQQSVMFYEISSRLAQAENADRQKSDFIAQMSHDIRSPLNNIRSILSLLRLDRSGPDLDEMVDVALTNCDSLTELVESILDYSRHKAGKLSSSPRLFDLGACVQAVVAGFTISAKLKGLELSFHNHFDTCPVYADNRHIRRVITNLISNAIKYTHSGSVSVSMRKFGAGRWGVLVKDTGCGLSVEQQKALFTPFTTFEGGSGDRAQTGGIGLGLALSRILAELNGGHIQVRSTPGAGAEFELSVPSAGASTESVELFAQAGRVEEQLLIQASRALKPVMPVTAEARVESSYSVLLIDDEPDCVETLERGLEIPGARVLKAFTVRDAVSICNFDPPDVIISDAEMPEGGATSLLKFVRAQGLSSSITILTGRDSEEASVEFLRLGASKVFTKPADLKALSLWISSAARKSEAGAIETQGRSKVA